MVKIDPELTQNSKNLEIPPLQESMNFILIKRQPHRDQKHRDITNKPLSAGEARAECKVPWTRNSSSGTLRHPAKVTQKVGWYTTKISPCHRGLPSDTVN